MNITIKMKDGTTQTFEERGRPGGSYCNSVKFSEGWAIITDEWGAVTAIPSELIAEVKQAEQRGRW